MEQQNIILIGFMGTGKSTVGRRLARFLGWEFIDTDQEIESVTGFSVSEIFHRFGEKRFRSEERLLVRRLNGRGQCVIATGGGTALNPENWTQLAQNGVMIGLYAPVEIVLRRIGQRGDRPLLKGTHQDVAELWCERQEAYAKAEFTVDTTDKSVDEVVGIILGYLERRGQG